MSGKYDDIISLPRPVSRHPRMPMGDRAAQFSPFQALSGHGDAIKETARLTDRKIELTEDEKTVLDEKLRLLLETGGTGVFTWFLPDERKDGGAYITAEGVVKKIDPLEGGSFSQMRQPFPSRTFWRSRCRRRRGRACNFRRFPL